MVARGKALETSAGKSAPPIAPRLLRKAEVATYVARSERWISDMVKAGKFPEPVRPGGPVADPLWDIRAVDQWVDALTSEAAAERERVDELMRGA